MFTDSTDLKNAIKDTDTTITFAATGANRAEAFAFGQNDPASVQMENNGLTEVGDWLNYAIKIETKSTGSNAKVSTILVYFGSSLMGLSNDIDVTFDGADSANPNGHIAVASSGTVLEAIRSALPENGSQTSVKKVETLSQVASVVILNGFYRSGEGQSFWGFVMGNFKATPTPIKTVASTPPSTGTQTVGRTIAIPKGILA